MADGDGSVTVRVPATSANLGPGFDSFGLALRWYDTVQAQPADDGLRIDVTGVGAQTVPRDRNHLVARALCAGFEMVGQPVPGLRLRCANQIPHGLGLGSSAAAITAGVRLARALSDDRGVSAQEWFALAVRLEGHPDNVAACWYGGLTLAWSEAETTRAARLDVDPHIAPVLLVPENPVPTSTARAVLPETVRHQAAAANAARAGLLVAALTGRLDLLLPATGDFLHQDYRYDAMPETLTLVRALRSDGVAAAVSGAGPSVVAFPVPGQDPAVRRRCPPGWTAHATAVAGSGAHVLDASDRQEQE